MKARFWILGSVIASAFVCVGAVGGFYLGTSLRRQQGQEMYLLMSRLSNVDLASRISRDAEVLSNLRTGNSARALSSLEVDLDGELARVTGLESAMPNELRLENFTLALKQAAEYRRKFPRDAYPGSGAELSWAADAALALPDNSRSSAPAP